MIAFPGYFEGRIILIEIYFNFLYNGLIRHLKIFVILYEPSG